MPENPHEDPISEFNGKPLPSGLRVLKGLEAVREKPGMYLGGTDERALHQCVSELLDNSIDEFLARHCTQVDLTIHLDGSVSIRDNGRGIPVEINQRFGLPSVEVALTVLYTGYSRGPHGVGAKCVNAVSEWFRAEVRRDGQVHGIGFERGKTTQPLKRIGQLKDQETTGTTITFKPDPLIFLQTTEFKAVRIRHRLQELAFTHPPLAFHFLDERIGGMKPECIQHRPGEFPIFGAPKSHLPVFGKPLEFAVRHEALGLRVVLQYAQTLGNEIYYYVNALHGLRGGILRTGFLKGLAKACTDFTKTRSVRRKFFPSDMECGLHAVVALAHPDPRFASSTKENLCSPDAEPFAAKVTATEMSAYLQQHPETARQILSHLVCHRRE